MLSGRWTKSVCSSESANCVQVRCAEDEVQVRDSKKPDAGILSFTFAEWDAFLDGAKKGEFDPA